MLPLKTALASTDKNSIVSYFTECDELYLIDNGTITSWDDCQREKIFSQLSNLFEGALDMPAFGVSIDQELRKELGCGVWLEFCYNNTREFNGMEFNKLLFKVEKDLYGLNIYREIEGKYEGRCFYISLKADMNNFALWLENF